jgi:predicted dehydrogenase
MGMVGGGEGAFIGAVHRAAARLDGDIELVCGAFSSRPEVARRSGAACGLDSSRVYDCWRSMIQHEAGLPEARRMQFVTIVTTNELHQPIACAALASGFHVFSEKPATRTLQEAQVLAEAVGRSGRLYGLAHTYLGYPMVREARERVLGGTIGTVRRVIVDYPQGWLATRLENTGHRGADWRTDPERSGPGGCIADIGVHAFNLAEYVTGLRVTRVCGDLGSVVPGRRVDDDVAAFLRFENGARGVLTSSQVATGEENSLTIRVYGELGGIAWSHRDPGTLLHVGVDGATTSWRAGSEATALSPAARSMCRTPTGHPEGFIEAFANLYRAFVADIRGHAAGTVAAPQSPAGIDAAVRGMSFIHAMQASDAANQAWMGIP